MPFGRAWSGVRFLIVLSLSLSLSFFVGSGRRKEGCRCGREGRGAEEPTDV